MVKVKNIEDLLAEQAVRKAATCYSRGVDRSDLDLLKSANELLKIPIIASGGAGQLKHFKDGFKIGKASALLAASIFHFKEFSIKEVKNFLSNNNIPVRM